MGKWRKGRFQKQSAFSKKEHSTVFNCFQNPTYGDKWRKTASKVKDVYCKQVIQFQHYGTEAEKFELWLKNIQDKVCQQTFLFGGLDVVQITYNPDKIYYDWTFLSKFTSSAKHLAFIVDIEHGEELSDHNHNLVVHVDMEQKVIIMYDVQHLHEEKEHQDKVKVFLKYKNDVRTRVIPVLQYNFRKMTSIDISGFSVIKIPISTYEILQSTCLLMCCMRLLSIAGICEDTCTEEAEYHPRCNRKGEMLRYPGLPASSSKQWLKLASELGSFVESSKK